MTVSTHVLDTATGRPATGVPIQVHRAVDGGWEEVGNGVTGPDGRAADLVATARWTPGRYRLVFAVDAHLGPAAFFPCITVEFLVTTAEHHHVPLLLSPYGYTTYRGS